MPRKPWSGRLGVGYKQSLGGPDGFGKALAEGGRLAYSGTGGAMKVLSAQALPTKAPLEVIVGVTFKVPLQNRKARGKVAESQAKIDELTVKQRYLAEKIRTEVAGIASCGCRSRTRAPQASTR